MTYHKHHRGPVYDPIPDYVITQQPRRRRHFRLLTPLGWMIVALGVVWVTVLWTALDWVGDVPGEITVEWVRE